MITTGYVKLFTKKRMYNIITGNTEKYKYHRFLCETVADSS